MYDWLDDLVDEIILAHPAKVKAIADARIKTDKIDSETLAHLLRANLIPKRAPPPKTPVLSNVFYANACFSSACRPW
jgi:transposase